MSHTPFWIVWAEDGGSPTYKHKSQSSAENEASRLANLQPGARFCVLPCVARYSVQRLTVERFEPEPDLPFSDLPF